MHFKNIKSFLKEAESKNSSEVLSGLSFVKALYSGKKFIRCPYTKRTGYATFNIKIDSLYELTTLHESEFRENNWEACNDEGFGKE